MGNHKNILTEKTAGKNQKPSALDQADGVNF